MQDAAHASDTCVRSMMLTDADDGAHTCMLLRTCLEACAIAILFIAMLAADLFAGSSALMKAVTAGKEGDTAPTRSACTFNVKPVSTSIAPPNHATCIGSYHKSHYTWHGFRRRGTRASAAPQCVPTISYAVLSQQKTENWFYLMKH